MFSVVHGLSAIQMNAIAILLSFSSIIFHNLYLEQRYASRICRFILFLSVALCSLRLGTLINIDTGTSPLGMGIYSARSGNADIEAFPPANSLSIINFLFRYCSSFSTLFSTVSEIICGKWLLSSDYFLCTLFYMVMLLYICCINI